TARPGHAGWSWFGALFPWVQPARCGRAARMELLKWFPPRRDAVAADNQPQSRRPSRAVLAGPQWTDREPLRAGHNRQTTMATAIRPATVPRRRDGGAARRPA